MNCELCEAKIPDHLTGRLDDFTAREVTRHIETCTACRAYRGEVEALYGVELPVHSRPPERLELPVAEPGRRVAAVVAAVAVLAAGITLAFLFDIRGGGERSAPVVTGVQLAAISMDLPRLPAATLNADWIDSRAEALLVSEYSGKPLLEQYINAASPRCAYVNDVLQQDDYQARLAEFVRFRSVVDDEIPSVLGERRSSSRIPTSLPAMFVTDGSCSTEPVFEVRGWDDVEGVLADYAEHCMGAPADPSESGELVPLDPDVFARTLAAMNRLPGIVDAGRYAEALEELRTTARLDETYRTRFAQEARRLEGELLASLDRRVSDLERFAARDESRSHARELAREMLPGVAGLALEERVRALCGG